ncbi:Mlo domain-containing protein [Cephalotus follicularis]|uniref:MLO-like protein n=1 Tax=Cephalotus follicularis TaxID=3775 RepID=A0A1Q3D1Q9_CEPFO|nr:Mlo domain-containing protein [Cephalotus follicularis]
MAEAESDSLEYTPTWVVALVCFIIVLLSLIAERGLHRLGKCLQREKKDALFEALQKLKEELMLLGFISLLLTVSQRAIIHVCIPAVLSTRMLPCKRETGSSEVHITSSHQGVNHQRKLLSTASSSEHCAQGKVPMLSLEALHHLHIFIFVLAVVHVIFCVTTMVLGGARIRQWKYWEESLWHESELKKTEKIHADHHKHFKLRAVGYWRKSAVISWLISFFKQFYGSVTKSDYIALRHGFIKAHCPSLPKFNFHKYMMRTLGVDFKKIVGISWYLWLFVVMFLLLNVEGWHTFFWLAFLPLILLLLVGAKLEHIITRMAQEVAGKHDQEAAQVNPSDEYFWFHRPDIVLHLIHFILFQNAFEIAFFFWIWCTYGFHSCIMEKFSYIIPRLFMGVVVQVLCSYSTLPLYALVTQMSSKLKRGIFHEDVHSTIDVWRRGSRSRGEAASSMHKMTKESVSDDQNVNNNIAEQEMIVINGLTELSSVPQMPMSMPMPSP